MGAILRRSGAEPHHRVQAMNLQNALRRTTAGVALVSALALGSGASLVLQPQAAQARQTVSIMSGGCFFFAGRYWCP
jgi:hypothetical protein